MPLLEFTNKGIYCDQAQVYIDPWHPVKKALITHGHSDHATSGHRQYIASALSVPIIKYRLGSHIQIQGYPYGETFSINGVKFSFHPAGHIVGSAQIRVEYKGEIWVASGDYKRSEDGLSTPFEVVKCHTFITESTFGLPAFTWKSQFEIINEINAWWQKNKEEGKISIIGAYALGKAQRIINNVDGSIGKIFTHGAIENTNEVLRRQGVAIAPTIKVDQYQAKDAYNGGLVIATPSAINSSWSRKFKSQSSANASGWMSLRGARRRRSVDRGFIMSDHADWQELLDTIKETGASTVYVTHGYTDIFSKYLREIGYDAHAVKTEYNGDEEVLSEDMLAETVE
ncbi:MAG TPA: ligase-associated DNA damage response exonuclease [Saprospiraceae bacterium]|nr:ligase-associated DNA damage response exonuclease [Saprospiraceae bacterium]